MRPVIAFMKLEASGGIVLFLSAVLAMLLANSPLSPYYNNLFQQIVGLHVGPFQISQPLLLWVNEGLMSGFFFLVGLELRQEWYSGTLKQRNRHALPLVAAIGGILVPALFYVFLNAHDDFALRGWGIPTATDIAFALGILSLLGSRIPIELKIFLTTLAIFDDIAAITIIALFYTEHISLFALVAVMVFTLLLWVCHYFRVQIMSIYWIFGICLWLSVFKSGVHATLAGLALAIFMPLDHFAKQPTHRLKHLESRLHPWVTFGVLPLFAFANCGVSLSSVRFQDFLEPIPLGIILGLFLGKQLGIMAASWLAVWCRWLRLPEGVNWWGMYGLSILCGIGFTMSLFIGALAFDYSGGITHWFVTTKYKVLLRLGVLSGSMIAGLVGYSVLSWVYPKENLSKEEIKYVE